MVARYLPLVQSRVPGQKKGSTKGQSAFQRFATYCLIFQFGNNDRVVDPAREIERFNDAKTLDLIGRYIVMFNSFGTCHDMELDDLQTPQAILTAA